MKRKNKRSIIRYLDELIITIKKIKKKKKKEIKKIENQMMMTSVKMK